MMETQQNGYYEKIADKLFPIFGVNSKEEALEFVSDPANLLVSADTVYMNQNTGAIDVASKWESQQDLIEVVYDVDSENWIEKE